MTDAPPTEVSIREITELVRLFEESGWSSLELDIHGMHLVLGKDGVPAHAPAAPIAAATGAAPAPAPAPAITAPAAVEAPVAPSSASAAAPQAAASTEPAIATARSVTAVEVRSPVVGAFWTAPSPGEPPFVQVGDRVEPGRQLAIVEVMKLMSDVSAPVAGVITEVCAANAEMVEYDQLLFVIDPDD